MAKNIISRRRSVRDDNDRLVIAQLGTRLLLLGFVAKTPLRITVTALAILLGASASLRAQGWPAGTVGYDKTIYAKIYIGVGDALAPPYPIVGVRVLLVSASKDTVRLTTDAAGATAAYVERGQYTLVTLDTVRAGGIGYSWELPMTIRPGMGDFELTAENAAGPPPRIIAESRGDVGARLSSKPAEATPVVAAPVVSNAHKQVVDAAGLGWEVFEQSFSRGAVWGTGLTAPTVEVTLMFNRENETRQLDHFPANWASLSNAELAEWLAKARRIRP